MSKKDLDAILESEIGAMGAEEQTVGLGKLKNKSIADLSVKFKL